jgi:P-type conjugative transfer protein TrbL
VEPTANIEVLTKLLKIFVFNWAAAAQRIVPDAMWLLVIFFGMELCICGVWFAFKREIDAWHLVGRVMTAIVFGWLILGWPTITTWLMKGFMAAGIKAGGDPAFTEVTLTNPDRILWYGLQATKVTFQLVADASLWAPKALLVNFFGGLMALGALLLYGALAVVQFLSLLQFYGNMAATLIMLPFGMLPWTRSLAEKAVAYLFASCMRIFIIAFVLSSALPLLTTAVWSANDALVAGFYTLVTAFALLGVAYKLNEWAQALMHGNPTLGIQDMHRFGNALDRASDRVMMLTERLADLAARTDANSQGAATNSSPPSRRRV